MGYSIVVLLVGVELLEHICQLRVADSPSVHGERRYQRFRLRRVFWAEVAELRHLKGVETGNALEVPAQTSGARRG